MLIATFLAALHVAAQVPTDSTADSTAIRRDAAGSRFVLDGTMLRRFFGDDPQLGLTLIPGVIVRRADVGRAGDADLSIRGSAFGDPSVYVDGAPVRLLVSGRPGLRLTPAAVAEAAITTGPPELGLGDVRSGVIEYTTLSGDQPFGGSVRAATDEVFPGVGFSRFDATLGGRFPGAERASWFLSGTLLGQQEHYAGLGTDDVSHYVPAGVDTVVGGSPLLGYADQRAFDWATDLRLHGKLTLPLGAGGSLSLTGVASELQERFFPGSAALTPTLYEGSRSTGRMVVANWQQSLGASRGRPLEARVNLSITSFGAQSGLLDPTIEAGTRSPTLGITLETLRFTGADSVPMPLTDQIIRNVRTNTGMRSPYLNQDSLRNFQISRANPYALRQFWPEHGSEGSLSLLAERRLQGRGSLEWRPGDHAGARLGVDFERADVSAYTSELIRQTDMDVFKSGPKRLGAFVSGRIESGSLRAEGDIRFDRFGSVGLFPITPGRIYSNPAWNFAASTDDTAYANSIARVFRPGRAHSGASFRLAVSARTLGGARVRASAGSWFEPPPLGFVLGGTNGDLDFTNTNSQFGRDLDFRHATLIELSLEKSLAPNLRADIALYRKTRPGYAARIRPFEDPLNVGDTVNLVVAANVEGPEDLGGEIALDWKAGSALAAALAVSLRNTEVTTGVGGVGVPGDLRDTYATRAIVLGAVARPPLGALSGLEASVFLRLTSGVTYMRAFGFISSRVTPDVDQPGGVDRLPWTKRLDVRISKTLHTGPGAWSIFAEARNVLGWRNLLSVFNQTGGVTNDQFREVVMASEFAFLQGEANNNSALQPDQSIILPASCSAWTSQGGAMDCVALKRVERQFGDGDGIYTPAEQTSVLHAFYDTVYGPTFFYGADRSIRLGVHVSW